MERYTYITEEVVNNTKYKSVFNEYNRDNYSIVVIDGKVFYIEARGISDRTHKLVVKETKRLYPGLHYLYDLEKTQ